MALLCQSMMDYNTILSRLPEKTSLHSVVTKAFKYLFNIIIEVDSLLPYSLEED
jgi:hypothetical protein